MNVQMAKQRKRPEPTVITHTTCNPQ